MKKDVSELKRLQKNLNRGMLTWTEFQKLVWDWYYTNFVKDGQYDEGNMPQDVSRATAFTFGLADVSDCLAGVDPFRTEVES